MFWNLDPLPYSKAPRHGKHKKQYAQEFRKVGHGDVRGTDKKSHSSRLFMIQFTLYDGPSP